MPAGEIIATLGLQRHPEGGWYAETFRDTAPDGARSTAIYFLLEEGETSAWHRVRNAAEVWHFYAGSPLEVAISLDGKHSTSSILGADLISGQRPQIVVPAGAWQRARSLGAWTLVGCTVAPGFEFSNFEMAPRGWSPGNV